MTTPVAGQWYTFVNDEVFEIVSVDPDDELIEIQYLDGDIEEMDFVDFDSMLEAGEIVITEAPEDWCAESESE